MEFPSPLAPGRLVQRYKRFFADVILDDGREITAHCPNPGAMLGLNTPGLPVWVSRSDNLKRKLAHTLELVQADGGLVGINTLHPNRLTAEALAADAIPELTGYATHRREVNYGANSRIDFLLEAPGRPRAWLEVNNVQPFYNAGVSSNTDASRRCWVEVKGVTLSRRKGLAEWPDCVSARGTRHLDELEARIAEGDRAMVLFIVQRSDCETFDIADDLDPAFGRALERATANGLEMLVYGCRMTLEGARISARLSFPRSASA